MNRAIFLAAVLMLTAGVDVYATTAPKDGGPLPQVYRDQLRVDRTAYQMQRAWIQKVRGIKEARDAYVRERIRLDGPMAASAPLPSEFVVGGTVRVPVFLGYFQSQSSPYPAATLQNKLFDAVSGTVTEYYDEVSYGNLVMTGTVSGWTQVSQLDTYYEGSTFGLVPGNARTGEFIKELLDANDGTVDFSLYDNDGPDGVPNSGDDDGFVDFAAFVHNEAGGECGGTANIWSHRWVYDAWPVSGGQPYTTNDAANGGGFIRISDYVIQPATNCAGSGGGVIDIGVFCHEFGHALGLPDLYDTEGNNGQGIGHWGIMGSGNWNSTDSPAHPCAWTRQVLGWVTPTIVDWTDGAVNIPSINATPVAYKLPFTDDRWRRDAGCAITGTYSLYCGLPEALGNARNWASAGPGGGYGSNWVETIERDFEYSGTGTVTWGFKYDYDLETGYDYAFAVIEVNGTETILRTYNGASSGTENVNVTTQLAPLSGTGGTYTLKYRVITDQSFSDDDGYDPSTCGALAIDDVTVTGGGESYSTGFETYVDGWHQDPLENPATEYWLVENRRRIGYDSQLHEEGLLIMHIDDEVAWAPFLGNSGGDSNVQVRGVFVEEANGDFDLNGAGSNRGENTDVFPGAAAKTSFTSATTPNTNDNTARATRVQVTNISASMATMTANMRAGDPAPQAASVNPSTVDNDNASLQIAVTGGLIRHGATFGFLAPASAGAPPRSSAAPEDIEATGVEWVDPTRLVGTINAYGKEPGSWDLVVTNPDGQTVVLPGALTVNFVVVATQLQSASLTVEGSAVNLRYQLYGQEPGETLRIYRAGAESGVWRLIEDDLRGDDHNVYEYRDTAVEPGATYEYRLVSLLDGNERELHRGSATVPAAALTLEQNVPNPFNPTTTIRFTLPQQSDVSLQIYDITGALVRELASGRHSAGPHDVQWNGRDNDGSAVGSGVYFYRLITGNRTLTRKMVLLK